MSSVNARHMRSHAPDGRLTARPVAVATVPGEASAGVHRLGIGKQRDGLVVVPEDYRPDQPAPLVMMLHGAGGDAAGGLQPFRSLAPHPNAILLAVDSRNATWDMLLGGYGPDVAFIDDALYRVFQRCAIDPAHVAVEGFSDGASYGLSLGLTNGDLFTHVIAFSPGFMAPASQRGKPHIYISHGAADRVLPVDRCSRRIAPVLRQAGYHVQYHEFQGPHVVPEEIAREALDWFAGLPAPAAAGSMA